MSENLTIANALISVQLDLTKYKQQLSQMNSQISGSGKTGMSNTGVIMGSALGAGIGSGMVKAIKTGMLSLQKYKPKGLSFADDISGLSAKGGWSKLEKQIDDIVKKKNVAGKKQHDQDQLLIKSQIDANNKLIKLDDQRKKSIENISSIMTKMALIGAGGIGLGIKNFISTTDQQGRILNGTILRLKTSFFQLTANIGKVANAKWDINSKLQSLDKWIKSITKGDISNFLDTAKLTIFIAGFAKMLTMAVKMADMFTKMRDAQIAASAASVASGGGKIGLLSKGGSMANIGATALAAIGLGAAFGALSDAMGGTAEAIKTIVAGFAWVEKAIETFVNAIVMIGKIIGETIALLYLAISDASKMDFGSAKRDLAAILDVPKDALNSLANKYDKTWNPSGSTGSQDQMKLSGSSQTGGFADLNRMFQKMFEENINQGLIDATSVNTESTDRNTQSIDNLAQALKDAAQGKSTYGDLEIRDGVWQSSGSVGGSKNNTL